MANITEVSQWENVIRQLENGEAATGGADGLANVQAKQLANRTQWLKKNYLPLTGGAITGALSCNGNDLAGAAIVAKYYNAETEIGYVKFVNGLLYQWGVIKESTTSGIVSMPLSYDKGYVVCAVNNADRIVQDEIDAVSAIPQTKQKFKYTKRYNNYWLNWFAIGRA